MIRLPSGVKKGAQLAPVPVCVTWVRWLPSRFA